MLDYSKLTLYPEQDEKVGVLLSLGREDKGDNDLLKESEGF